MTGIYRGVGTSGTGISVEDLVASKVDVAGDTMTGYLTVPAGATGAQVPQRQEIDTLLALKASTSDLALKANIASPTFTGIVGGIDGTMIVNTPAGGISAITAQSAINELDTEKANIASPTFTGTVGGITGTMVGNTPAGNISSILIQDAINELDTEKAAIAQTMYIGTTAVAINRASGAIDLTGITSIDGNAATATTATTVSNFPQVSVRQTVLQSPVDTSGFPSFLPATFASLVVVTQNVSTGLSSFVATASQGSNLYGGINVIGQSTTNLTWPACTASNTNYLPILISGGTLTPQTPVILAPIYQWGGTPAVTSGQYTFNIQQMTMYLGNGATAPAVNHVIVGEVVAGVGTITSTVAYALMGRYDSGYTATVPTGYISKNHNIGTDICSGIFLLKNITTDLSYVVDDIVTPAPNTTNGAACPVIRKNTIAIQSGGTGTGWALTSRATGGMVAITAANWSYKFIASRSF